MTPAALNPFRAERLDALPYRPHDAAETLGDVIERFRRVGWRGAVVGPHGTGKSTLMRCLAAAAEAEGRVIWRVFVNRNTRAAGRAVEPPRRTDLWAIDGWCHLTPRARWRLRRLARRRGAGVLGTAHLCGWGLPVVHRTGSTPEVLAELAETLAPGGEIDAPGLLTAHGGNVREALFALYDREAGRRSTPKSPATRKLAAAVGVGTSWRITPSRLLSTKISPSAP